PARAPDTPLLQDRIAATPQRQSEAHAAFPVADAHQAVFAPAVRTAARMIVGKIIPAGSIRRIIFAHSAPLPLGKIGSPALPVLGTARVLGKPLQFGATTLRPGHQWFPSTTMMFLIPDLSKMGSRNSSMEYRPVMSARTAAGQRW